MWVLTFGVLPCIPLFLFVFLPPFPFCLCLFLHNITTPTPNPTQNPKPKPEPIQSSLYAEWQDQYLDYNGLKADLKAGTNFGAKWTAERERAFVNRLERELLKCEDFQIRKVSHGGVYMLSVVGWEVSIY